MERYMIISKLVLIVGVLVVLLMGCEIINIGKGVVIGVVIGVVLGKVIGDYDDKCIFIGVVIGVLVGVVVGDYMDK